MRERTVEPLCVGAAVPWPQEGDQAGQSALLNGPVGCHSMSSCDGTRPRAEGASSHIRPPTQELLHAHFVVSGIRARCVFDPICFFRVAVVSQISTRALSFQGGGSPPSPSPQSSAASGWVSASRLPISSLPGRFVE